MHFIICRLSGKHGGTDTLSKAWLFVVYSFFPGRENAVDLPEVMWQDFRKIAIKRKPNEISSPRIWALTIQQLYKERSEPIPVATILKEVYVTFKTIKHYLIPDQSSFRPIRHLHEHMLDIIPSGSINLKHHLETSVVYDSTQPAPISIEPTPEMAKHTSSGGKKKKSAKRKTSPSKPKTKKRAKVSSSSHR